MRIIKLNGVSCEVSKSEAKRAAEIQFMDASKRFAAFVDWMHEHDNDGTRARRRAVGVALGLIGPVVSGALA